MNSEKRSFDIRWVRYTYLTALSVFLMFIGQVLYSLWVIELPPVPEDYCLEYTEQLNDDDPMYCVRYKSKYIHAICKHSEYLAFHKYNYFWREFGIVVILVFCSGVINYSTYKLFPRLKENANTLNDTVLSSIVLPFIFLTLLSFYRRSDYYKLLVPEFVKEMNEKRVQEELDFVEWELENNAEYYEGDPN